MNNNICATGGIFPLLWYPNSQHPLWYIFEVLVCICTVSTSAYSRIYMQWGRITGNKQNMLVASNILMHVCVICWAVAFFGLCLPYRNSFHRAPLHMQWFIRLYLSVYLAIYMSNIVYSYACKQIFIHAQYVEVQATWKYFINFICPQYDFAISNIPLFFLSATFRQRADGSKHR